MWKQKRNEQGIRTAFQKQAKGFSNKQLSLNREELLQWIHQSLRLHADMNVADIAAGTGILSRYIARHVRQVTSIDLSPDMIAEGIKQNEATNQTNIDYVLAHAEQLPCSNGSFDLVISRLAFHHFINPKLVLKEMARVCTSTGAICVVDMISPENDTQYDLYNHYERLRDPSHAYALKKTELIRLFDEAGLQIQTIETIDVPIHVDRWLALTATDEQTAAAIIADIQLDIAGKKTTGLFPYQESDELMFKQTWIKLVAKQV